MLTAWNLPGCTMGFISQKNRCHSKLGTALPELMEPSNIIGQYQSFQDQFHSSYEPNDQTEFTLFSEPPFPHLYSLEFGVYFQVFLVRYAWYSLICWYFMTLAQYSILDFHCSTKEDHCPGEGNGNPLQYFCLENSMDREAWQVTVDGVAKNLTRLSTRHMLTIHKERLLQLWRLCQLNFSSLEL